MNGVREGKSGSRGRDACLTVSLRAAASHIRASDGRDIPFGRAVLSISNVCPSGTIEVLPRASLGQEGGTVQDVSRVFGEAAASLPAGGTIEWDVYDLLLPAHPGTASKVHMFGYRAVLNWKFELTASAEYRQPGSAEPAQTPVSRWTLRWSVPDPSTGAVELSIEEGKG